MESKCYIDRCIASRLDRKVMMIPVGRYPIGRYEETEIEFIKSETFVNGIPFGGLKRDAETGMEGCVVYVFRTEEEVRSDSMRKKYNHVELLDKGEQFIDDEYLLHIKKVADRTLAARSLWQPHKNTAGVKDENDKPSEKWVSQDDFLYIKGLEISSLRTYRNRGEKSKDGRSGTDTQGNRWRKTGRSKNESPEYLLKDDE